MNFYNQTCFPDPPPVYLTYIWTWSPRLDRTGCVGWLKFRRSFKAWCGLVDQFKHCESESFVFVSWRSDLLSEEWPTRSDWYDSWRAVELLFSTKRGCLQAKIQGLRVSIFLQDLNARHLVALNVTPKWKRRRFGVLDIAYINLAKTSPTDHIQ